MEAERAYPVSTIYMEAGAASGRRKELGEGIEMGHKEERNRERQGEEGILKAIRVEAVR